MDHHFQVDTPLQVSVKVLNARVEVGPADEGTATCVVQPLDPTHDASVQLAASAGVHLRGNRLEVTVREAGPALREAELLVRLGLPARSGLAVHAGKASIHVRGGLDVLEARLGAGDVAADTVDRTLTVKAGQVDVTVIRAGKVSLAAGQAILRAQRVRDTDFKAAHGKVELGRTDGNVVAKGAAVDLVVRAAGQGAVDFQAVTGSARVAVVAGTAVQLDLTSATGSVRCELPHESDLRRGDVGLKLRLRSGTGDLVVTSAAAAEGDTAG